MFCNKCGNQIENDAQFCRFCGATVSGDGNVPFHQPMPIYNNAVHTPESVIDYQSYRTLGGLLK